MFSGGGVVMRFMDVINEFDGERGLCILLMNVACSNTSTVIVVCVLVLFLIVAQFYRLEFSIRSYVVIFKILLQVLFFNFL